jgi:predicted phosphodiesterase
VRATRHTSDRRELASNGLQEASNDIVIWFVGDQHASFDFIGEAIDAAPVTPAAVILLGDMEAPIPLTDCMADVTARGVPWYWIIGNHDTDHLESFRNLDGAMDRCLDGRVVEIAGQRIAGLGGVFRGQIWLPPAAPSFDNYEDYSRSLRRDRGLKQRVSKADLVKRDVAAHGRADTSLQDESRDGRLLKHHSTIFPSTVANLAKQRADILVTHEAPSAHHYGFAALDDLARAMGARTLFHGHHHVERDHSEHAERLGFHAISVGLRGIVDQDGHVIRAGEKNAIREGERG